jgi:uncharacterized protein
MKRHKFLTSVLAATAAMALAGSALAQSPQAKATVDQAKAQGVVGEQSDGFLGFVSGGGDAAVQAAVAEINAGRAQLYRDAAARNGVTVAAAGASAFEQVARTRLKAGEYYRQPDGSWVRK